MKHMFLMLGTIIQFSGATYGLQCEPVFQPDGPIQNTDSIWFADIANTPEEDSCTREEKIYLGIFTSPPSEIAKRLSRPKTPFVPAPPYSEQD
jgi:hypothetical protein